MDDFIYHEPAAQPPTGVQSNFEQPSGQNMLANALVILALTSVTIFAWLRLYIKICIMRQHHAEDYLVPIAWIAAVGQATCGLKINSIAPLVHTWDLTLYTYGRYLLFLRVGAVCYNISIVLMKVSVLIQVLRIFYPHGRSRKTYLAAHALMWSNIIYYTISIFMFIFTCDPVAKAWKPWIPGKCRNMGAMAISMAAANLVGDLLVLFITQRAICELLRMREDLRRKLHIMFFAGIVPCGFAVMCLVYSSKYVHTHDFAYASTLMWMACYGETSSVMFVLLLPVLPRFFIYLRTLTSATFMSSHPRGVAEMVPSQPGQGSGKSGARELPLRKPGLYSVSYTERNSDEEMQLTSKAVNATDLEHMRRRASTVSESSLRKLQDDGSTASRTSLQFNEEEPMGVGMAITTGR